MYFIIYSFLIIYGIDCFVFMLHSFMFYNKIEIEINFLIKTCSFEMFNKIK